MTPPTPGATAEGPSSDVSLRGLGSLPTGVTVHVYDHVYRLVRHALLSRAIEPGARVVESALAEHLQVSRTPVRDALRRLEADGLLVRTPGGSLAVHQFSDLEIADIFRVRRELDALTARMACERGRPGDWEPLRAQAVALGDVVARFGARSYERSEAHEALHRSIYRIAFAPAVASALGERMLGLAAIASELSYAAGPDEPIVAQHLDLVDALASGDPAAAVAASDRHCDEARHSAAGPPGLPEPGDPA